jgi:threonylcarbamoyladenosine tRNA methylthiotransferase MtaB
LEKILKKYFVYTFGCKVNKYESQLILQKLQKDGFSAAKGPGEADIIIFNSCSVTNAADKECLYFIRKTLKLNPFKKIILTGCMAKNKYSQLQKLFPQIEILEDKTALYENPKVQSVNNFDGRARAFLKIQDGCDSFCSYCIIPYIRNTLWSKPADLIISEIEKLADKGYFEIVLTGIHIGKFDGGLSTLLEKIVDIKKNFRIRLSSIELNEIDDKLVSILEKNPDKICSHLHIPLQSGSDKILNLMNRKYNVKDYAKKIKNLAKIIPNICISADVIAGFPKESAKDHSQTIDFILSNPFSRLHIFRYSDRDGTKASQFDGKVSMQEIKKRAKELIEIDAKKRKEFLQLNIGRKRKAVFIGKNKALTDNYICIPNVENIENKNGIFEIEINKESVV